MTGVGKWFSSTLGSYSASSLHHATRASRKSFLSGLNDEISALEENYVSELLKTHDAKEGIQAFLDKRTPEWRDD